VNLRKFSTTNEKHLTSPSTDTRHKHVLSDCFYCFSSEKQISIELPKAHPKMESRIAMPCGSSKNSEAIIRIKLGMKEA
jgi:hypothetical protein